MPYFGATSSRNHRSRDAAEKNTPLVDDIRLLGRILGDVIREQEGKAAFELVERVGQPKPGRVVDTEPRTGRDAKHKPKLDQIIHQEE